MGDYVDDNVHPPTLEQQTPDFLSSFFDSGFSVLSEYGWYMLIFGLVFYCVWIKKIKPLYDQWKKEMDEKAYSAKYHKDPARFQVIQQTMEATRRKMQEELEIKAQLYIEKQKKIEEANSLERIADWERHEKGLGYRSKMKPKEEDPGTSDKKQFKSSIRPVKYSS